jgi:ADP-heptose:LPS heptosyltransferase
MESINKTIGIRAEGGAGDILLFNRFIPAIKEKYPDYDIYLYVDSEGKTFQKELIEILYPSFYKEVIVIPHKKYKECYISSQFGEEKSMGVYENVPDEWRAKIESHDIWYDGHIDSLKWVDYDFDWLRYYRFFPKPDLQKLDTKEEYVAFHLMSNTKNDHGLERWYIERIVEEVSKFIKCKLICTNDIRNIYSKFENYPNVEILAVGLKEACLAISAAKLMFSIDSGLRVIGYSYGIPTLCLSRQVSAPFQPFPSHQLRWMPFPETCFPLNYDCIYMANFVKKVLSNKAYILVPQLTHFDNQAIRRNYTVLPKSILL